MSRRTMDLQRAADLLQLAHEAEGEAQKKLEEEAQAILRSPSIPRRAEKVLVASGHMIDAPGRGAPRFPPRIEAEVRARIGAALDRIGAGGDALAISGGARGTDILFEELCLERGVHVVQLISLPLERFVQKSVRLLGTDWEARFLTLLKRCETYFQHERLGPPPEGLSPYARNNLWILHRAGVEAEARPIHAILVWDETDAGDGPGGTAHFAAEIAKHGHPPVIINPLDLIS